MIRIIFRNICFDHNHVKIADTAREAGFTISGHAGFALRGNDIICAAVSSIGQTAVLAINKIAEVPQRLEQCDGFLSSFILPENMVAPYIGIWEIIISTMCIGLVQMEKEHPDYIMISFE